MTDTTTTTPARVYVRRLGYARLLEVHPDHSATVACESGDGTEHVPFGDWSYDRSKPGTGSSTVEVLARIKTALGLDFGDDFAEVSSGVGPGRACWSAALFGGHEVRIQVTPEA